MPTVPTTFVPQVSPGGDGDIGQFQAPGVQPMENLFPQQQQAFGRAMTRVGDVAFSVGAAIQDEVDEAATKEADVATISAMTDISSRYLATAGKDAESQYGAVMAELAQAGATGMDGLQNDTQRRMFSPVVARNMTSFQTRITEHRNKQAKAYAINESAARSEQYADLAIRDWRSRNMVDRDGKSVGPFHANVAVAVNETRNAARLLGIPEDSAQTQQMVQKVYDRVATGVVNEMLNAKEYGEADAFLDNQAERIDTKVADGLRTSIDANRQRTTVEELTNNIRERGVLAAESNPDAYPAQEGASKPPESLQDALELAEGIKDPVERRAVQSNLRTQYAQDEALATQQYQAVLDSAYQIAADPAKGFAAIPPAVLGSLKATDRAKLESMRRDSNDALVMNQFYANPNVVQSSEWLDSVRYKVTPETFYKLKDMATKPEKLIPYSVDTAMVNKTLSENGLGEYATETRDKRIAERKNALVVNIETMIDVQQRSIGRQLNRDERQKVIDQAIITYGWEQREIAWWPDVDRRTKLPIAMMTPEERRDLVADREIMRVGNTDVPAVEFEAAERSLVAKGVRRPSVADIMREYRARKAK